MGEPIVRKGKGKASRKKSWEAKELSDIDKNWKPQRLTKEGQRKIGLRKT